MRTILVADDDPLLLDVVARTLADPSFTVLTASDGFEAVRILADRHVDLMIADINMPGLDGLQLALQAKVMRPNLHIIFISGTWSERAALPSFGTLMEKPIRPRDLLDAVRLQLALG
jgi:DNA-binding response OmpR family regulator